MGGSVEVRKPCAIVVRFRIDRQSTHPDLIGPEMLGSVQRSSDRSQDRIWLIPCVHMD
jgi:hypothetical protein